MLIGEYTPSPRGCVVAQPNVISKLSQSVLAGAKIPISDLTPDTQGASESHNRRPATQEYAGLESGKA